MEVRKNKIMVENLCKTYHTNSGDHEVLKDISFNVEENEFLVLLGPGRCEIGRASCRERV